MYIQWKGLALLKMLMKTVPKLLKRERTLFSFLLPDYSFFY